MTSKVRLDRLLGCLLLGSFTALTVTALFQDGGTPPKTALDGAEVVFLVAWMVVTAVAGLYLLFANRD